MIRTLLLSASILAVSTFAQAQEVRVEIAGKAPAAIKADIMRAAQKACSDAFVPDYAPCVEEAYAKGMDDAARIKAGKSA
jgi:hypothetical protein